jgi:hypothetical protein
MVAVKKLLLILLMIAMIAVFAVGVTLEQNQAPAIQTDGVSVAALYQPADDPVTVLLAAIGIAVSITVVMFYDYLRRDSEHRQPLYGSGPDPYLRL